MKHVTIAIGVLGVLALLAAVHWAVTLSPPGSRTARALEPTCAWCH
jgi:hypothetical protein